MNLPSAVPSINLSAIEKRTEDKEQAAMKTPELWAALEADRQTQEYFLNNFRKTFNISLSLALVSASFGDYRRWQTTDIHFVTLYNDIHDEWKSRIMASAATRAVGYLSKADPSNPTSSGFVEDAAGTPIYEGADSRLSLRFLETLHPEFSPKQDINLHDAREMREIEEGDTGADAGDIYADVIKR